jgi:hypothetical protein
MILYAITLNADAAEEMNIGPCIGIATSLDVAKRQFAQFLRDMESTPEADEIAWVDPGDSDEAGCLQCELATITPFEVDGGHCNPFTGSEPKPREAIGTL